MQTREYLFHLATAQATTILTDRDGSVVRDQDGQPIEVVDHSACLPAALFWLNANQHISRRRVNLDSANSVKQHTEIAKVYEYVRSLAEGNAKKVLRRKNGTVERDSEGRPIFVIDLKACCAAEIWWMKHHHGWKERHPSFDEGATDAKAASAQ